jgi:hypothetical protein
MTPLRQRMIEDMQLRGFSARTQECYAAAVGQLAKHYHCSPDQPGVFIPSPCAVGHFSRPAHCSVWRALLQPRSPARVSTIVYLDGFRRLLHVTDCRSCGFTHSRTLFFAQHQLTGSARKRIEIPNTCPPAHPGI